MFHVLREGNHRQEQEKTQSIPSETARATEGREKRGEERPQEDSGDLDTRDEVSSTDGCG